MEFNDAKYKEVSDLVRNIKLDDLSFNLFDIYYFLRMCPHYNTETNQVNGHAAEYITPCDGNGFGIYIWNDLEEKIQRVLLLHEIIEVFHRNQGMEATPAHDATIPWERRFRGEYLTASETKKYLKFKKDNGGLATLLKRREGKYENQG